MDQCLFYGSFGSMSNAEAFQQLLDCLHENIAILDEKGIIIAVNECWTIFSQQNGTCSNSAYIGDNYLDICVHASGLDAEEAPAVYNGLQKVLHGELDSFTIEYPCHSQSEERWFSMSATPLRMSGYIRGAVVSHTDITKRRIPMEEAHKNKEQHA